MCGLTGRGVCVQDGRPPGGGACRTLFFSLIPEVARRGLRKVVKSICSGEGGKEKRLVARGRSTKGKLCVGSIAFPGRGVARLV